MGWPARSFYASQHPASSRAGTRPSARVPLARKAGGLMIGPERNDRARIILAILLELDLRLCKRVAKPHDFNRLLGKQEFARADRCRAIPNVELPPQCNLVSALA